MKFKGWSALLFPFFLVVFFSCTKINEATELGGDLIPAVDNVNTFEANLEATTSYRSYDDSTRNLITDNMALGKLNDPVFGTTSADMYFNLSSPTYGSSPFTGPISVQQVDSVVLSLAYSSGYGDTSAATGSQISVQVSEIASGNDFYDSVLYRYDSPGFSTTGAVLGNRSFSISQLKDSVKIRLVHDSTTVGGVLRIRLNNSLGQKLVAFDSTASGPYGSDSLFRKAFRGLAVKTTSVTGNGALAYFALTNTTGSQLTVYYRKLTNGSPDTTSVSFVHSSYSQANSVKRTPAGAYVTNLNNANAQNLYLQSSPGGSYIGIKFPGLDNFPNRVIHRAELIAYRVPDPLLDNIFTAPTRLFLDHKGSNNSKDSAYLFNNDLQTASDGSLNFSSFGGTLRTDNTYRFNITRYVQGLVTRGERNDSLRLFAPLRSNVYSKTLAQVISIPNLDNIAGGRVVLAGSTYPTPAMRLRLHIIYSNL